MKTLPKTLLIVVNIVFISILCFFGIMFLFNSLVDYKSATTNDFISFFGSVIGSLIGALVAIISLLLTLKHNYKNQIKNNNLQTSINVADNLNHRLESERTIISASYNNLEKFLYISMNIIPNNNNYDEMSKTLINLYSDFCSTVNLIRFNSNIFYDNSRCEGCDSCYIKTYGLLVKNATLIRNELTQIETECGIVINNFSSALSIATKILTNKAQIDSLLKVNAINQQIVDEKIKLLHQPRIEADNAVSDEINNLLKESEENRNIIKSINRESEKHLQDIAVYNNNARIKAKEIDAKNKINFSNSIYKYFESYKLYITEYVYAIEHEGKKSNYGCSKLNFEKNHNSTPVTS